MEGGGFLKQLQNRYKNIKRKLEKIQAKEKRPASELNEEEKESMRNKPILEILNQEYERVIANYQSSREASGIVEPAKPEVRTEVREEDNAARLLELWVALYFASLPAAQELYLEQDLPKEALDAALSFREQILGKPGDSLQALHAAALPLFAQVSKSADSSLAGFVQWTLQQKVPAPPPVPVLQVHSLPQQDIVHTVEPEPAPVQPPVEVPAEVPVEAPKEEPAESPKQEELKTNWVDQEEAEEESQTAPAKESEAPEDDGFIIVGKKERVKKPPHSEPRGRRGARRGRGWRGDRGAQ